MIPSVLPSELTFNSDGTNNYFFFRKQFIGQQKARSPKTLKSDAIEVLNELAKGEGEQNYLRAILEIQLGRKFPVFYTNFDVYVRDWPEAERSRRWITNDGHSDVLIFQGEGPHSGIPGGYLWAHLIQFDDRTWGVRVHDCDDGAVFKQVPDEEDGKAICEASKQFAPIGMQDLNSVLGFRYD
jgi:hypothetical protein